MESAMTYLQLKMSVTRKSTDALLMFLCSARHFEKPLKDHGRFQHAAGWSAEAMCLYCEYYFTVLA